MKIFHRLLCHGWLVLSSQIALERGHGPVIRTEFVHSAERCTRVDMCEFVTI